MERPVPACVKHNEKFMYYIFLNGLWVWSRPNALVRLKDMQDGRTYDMGFLRNVTGQLAKPVIANKRDLRVFVIATTLVCLAVALSADVVNQLVFFEGWPTAFRNWAITCSITVVVAAPVSLAVGRTTLELAVAKQTISDQLEALQQAHEATAAAHELAQSLARHDALTGLPNRRVFAEVLDEAVVRTHKGLKKFAVLSIDLDRFKPVNDIYGHAIGDAVLCKIADRLREIVRKDDTVARFGGDEFGVVLEVEPSADLEGTAAQLADRIIRQLQRPIDISGKRIEVGASVGTAICPKDGADAEALLRAADMAMYQAKQDGRGKHRFFENDMETELLIKTALEEDVRHAVVSGAIQPHYQPLVRLVDNRLVGFEILARWRHPIRGDIGPSVFIPVVEKLGLIGELTYTLLRRACRDARNWPQDITISLNISPIHFGDPLLPVKFLSILSETGFPPTRLEVEVTETALIEDLTVAQAALHALRNVGIKVSLDDFGTGYSNLYYLRELPFDKIKIDQSFIKSMATDANHAKIVHSVLELAKTLGMPAIAEGVEDREIINELKQAGAEFGQGFYFSKAVSAAAADQLVHHSSENSALNGVA